MGLYEWMFGSWGGLFGNSLRRQLIYCLLYTTGLKDINRENENEKDQQLLQIVEQQEDEDQDEEFEIIEIENNKQEEEIDKIIQQD